MASPAFGVKIKNRSLSDRFLANRPQMLDSQFARHDGRAAAVSVVNIKNRFQNRWSWSGRVLRHDVERAPREASRRLILTKPTAQPQQPGSRAGRPVWSAVAERSGDTALGTGGGVRKRRGAPLPAAVQNRRSWFRRVFRHDVRCAPLESSGRLIFPDGIRTIPHVITNKPDSDFALLSRRQLTTVQLPISRTRFRPHFWRAQ